MLDLIPFIRERTKALRVALDTSRAGITQFELASHASIDSCPQLHVHD
jgi:hypothetical protein